MTEGRMTEAQTILRQLQRQQPQWAALVQPVMDEISALHSKFAAAQAKLDAQAQRIAELEWAFSHIVYLKTMKYPGKDRDWNESEIYRIAEKYAAKPQAQQADAALTGPKETP